MENISNDYSTTLNGGITDVAVTLVVTSATGAPAANFRLRIDDEIMLCTSKAGATYTVTRGVEGTVAAAHLNGATVAHLITKAGLDGYAQDYWGFFKSSVDAGITRTIPAGYSQVVVGGFTVDGDLQLDGDMAII